MHKLDDFRVELSNKRTNKRKRENKVFGLIITAVVIGLLFIAGPVDALHLSLSGFKNTPYNYGETVSFTGKIDILSQEILNVQNVSLEVNDAIVCTFDVYGKNLTSCNGISIVLASNTSSYVYGYGSNSFELGWSGSNRSSNAGSYNGSSYGYGYGYSNGELKYNISIQTPQSFLRIPGNNEIKLIANSDSQTFNSRTEHITIQPQSSNNGNNNGGPGRANNEEGRRNNLNNNSNNQNSNLVQNNNNRNNQRLSNPTPSPELIQNLGNSENNENTGITGNAVGNSFGINGFLIGTIFMIIAVGVLIAVLVIRRRNSFKEPFRFYSSYY